MNSNKNHEERVFKIMRNKYCLLGSGLILSANTMIATNPDGAKSVLPNVIIIYADDLGYGL